MVPDTSDRFQTVQIVHIVQPDLLWNQMHNWIFQKKKNVWNWTLKVLSLFQTPFTVSRLSRPWHCPAILTLEVEVQLRFENKVNVGIEVPKVQLSFSKEGICSENLPWFQTTFTVSRLSRPWDCPALLPGVQNMCQRVSTADRHFFYFARHFLCVTQNGQKMTPNGQKMTKNGQKMTQNGKKLPKIILNDPKWPRMVQKWPKMAQNGPKMTFLKCRDLRVLPGTFHAWPKMAEKWPKMTKKWPKMAKNDPKWPKNDPKWQKMTQNYPKWPQMA